MSRLLSALVLLPLLAACTEPVDAELYEEVDGYLERLERLDVFEVGAFVDPTGDFERWSTKCGDYSPGDMDALDRDRNLRMLGWMTETAEFAVDGGVEPGRNACETPVIELNLQKLRDIGAVELGELVETRQSCGMTEEQVAEDRCERAEDLSRIVQALEL